MERCARLMPLGISPLCNDLAVYHASMSEIVYVSFIY